MVQRPPEPPGGYASKSTTTGILIKRGQNEPDVGDGDGESVTTDVAIIDTELCLGGGRGMWCKAAHTAALTNQMLLLTVSVPRDACCWHAVVELSQPRVLTNALAAGRCIISNGSGHRVGSRSGGVLTGRLALTQQAAARLGWAKLPGHCGLGNGHRKKRARTRPGRVCFFKRCRVGRHTCQRKLEEKWHVWDAPGTPP
eukprot:gene14483-biopygen574